MTSRTTTSLWLAAAVGSVAIGIYSYRYLLPDPVLSINLSANLMLRPWLYVHAAMAATALILGPFQFVTRIRIRLPAIHRRIGGVYVTCCLIGAIAGFMLGGGSAAGPIAQAGFICLAVCWFVANVQALRLARNGRYAAHRRWMIRSFALTFSAVTLRIYVLSVLGLGFPFMPAYVAIAWLAWVPNLIVAEIFLGRENRIGRVARQAHVS